MKTNAETKAYLAGSDNRSVFFYFFDTVTSGHPVTTANHDRSGVCRPFEFRRRSRRSLTSECRRNGSNFFFYRRLLPPVGLERPVIQINSFRIPHRRHCSSTHSVCPVYIAKYIITVPKSCIITLSTKVRGGAKVYTPAIVTGIRKNTRIGYIHI